MRELQVLIGVLFFAYYGHAQPKAIQHLPSTAAVVHVENKSFSYSLGQSVVKTLSTDGRIITQGFHQPLALSTNVSELPELSSISVYPNPTSGLIQLEITEDDITDVHIKITNNLGQLVNHEWIEGHLNIQRSYNLGDLTDGVYHLSIYSNQQNLLFKQRIILQK